MTEFQIRGDDHDYGPLSVRRTIHGEIVLDDHGTNIVGLGDDEDALLVAKCIEVAVGREDRHLNALTPEEREKLKELQETKA